MIKHGGNIIRFLRNVYTMSLLNMKFPYIKVRLKHDETHYDKKLNLQEFHIKPLHSDRLEYNHNKQNEF